MIAGWMVYALGISALIGGAAIGLEAALRAMGRPTRWAWALALLASVTVPFVWALLPAPLTGVADVAAPIALDLALLGEIGGPAAVATPTWGVPETPWMRGALLLLWALSALGALAIVWVSNARLARLRRGWIRRRIGRRDVLIAKDVGPAVVGVKRPTIVLPGWLLRWERASVELVLAHEEEHLRARDTQVLAAGFALVCVAPWNLPLWWQFRRLRLAVEMDCDARVLSRGARASAYGRLLLAMGQRKAGVGLPAAAVAEPAGMLERRLRAMTKRGRSRNVGGALGGAVAAILIGAMACEVPPPTRVVDHASEGTALFTAIDEVATLEAKLVEVEKLAAGDLTIQERNEVEHSRVRLQEMLEAHESALHDDRSSDSPFGTAAKASPIRLSPELRVSADGGLSVDGRAVELDRVLTALRDISAMHPTGVSLTLQPHGDVEPAQVKSVLGAVDALQGVSAWVAGTEKQTHDMAFGEAAHDDGAKVQPHGESSHEGARPVIIVDGVLSDEASLKALDHDNIERIEVLKGEAAVEAGYPHADGGVVQVFLKDPARKESNANG